MTTKEQVLHTVKAQFEAWETLLGSLAEAQLTTTIPKLGTSIKEIMAHLYAWQLVSIARLEAGLHHRTPVYPSVPSEFDLETDSLDTESNVDDFNAWAYQTYGTQPWTEVHTVWRDGFLRFVELGEAIPEAELLDKQRYDWLEGYSLADIMIFSDEHHQEHIDMVRAELQG